MIHINTYISIFNFAQSSLEISISSHHHSVTIHYAIEKFFLVFKAD